MAKGFIKYETNELEYLTIKTAYTCETLSSARVYLPKKYAGRRVLIAVPAEKKGEDGNE